MQNGAVLCALGFFLRSARAVVDVPALKQKATIGFVASCHPRQSWSRLLCGVRRQICKLYASHRNSSSSSRARRRSRSARATAPGRAEREKPMSRRRLSIFEGAAACVGRRTLNAQPSTCNGQLKHRERAPHRWHAPNSQRSRQGAAKKCQNLC